MKMRTDRSVQGQSDLPAQVTASQHLGDGLMIRLL